MSEIENKNINNSKEINKDIKENDNKDWKDKKDNIEIKVK